MPPCSRWWWRTCSGTAASRQWVAPEPPSTCASHRCLRWLEPGCYWENGLIRCRAWARFSSSPEYCLPGLTGCRRRSCHPERSEGSLRALRDPSVVSLPQDDKFHPFSAFFVLTAFHFPLTFFSSTIS